MGKHVNIKDLIKNIDHYNSWSKDILTLKQLKQIFPNRNVILRIEKKMKLLLPRNGLWIGVGYVEPGRYKGKLNRRGRGNSSFFFSYIENVLKYVPDKQVDKAFENSIGRIVPGYVSIPSINLKAKKLHFFNEISAEKAFIDLPTKDYESVWSIEKDPSDYLPYTKDVMLTLDSLGSVAMEAVLVKSGTNKNGATFAPKHSKVTFGDLLNGWVSQKEVLKKEGLERIFSVLEEEE